VEERGRWPTKSKPNVPKGEHGKRLFTSQVLPNGKGEELSTPCQFCAKRKRTEAPLEGGQQAYFAGYVDEGACCQGKGVHGSREGGWTENQTAETPVNGKRLILDEPRRTQQERDERRRQNRPNTAFKRVSATASGLGEASPGKPQKRLRDGPQTNAGPCRRPAFRHTTGRGRT